MLFQGPGGHPLLSELDQEFQKGEDRCGSMLTGSDQGQKLMLLGRTYRCMPIGWVVSGLSVWTHAGMGQNLEPQTPGCVFIRTKASNPVLILTIDLCVFGVRTCPNNSQVDLFGGACDHEAPPRSKKTI